ncbi:hypothetical protein CYMTET_52369 [Cymbomonas tetramitiformis]|uniref:mRNA (guanine-N(7))-methyltransferase n=1 Tax=Cymbomonas tetramitiformis TaxID=36881 RepID=A0AAE0EST8_9CHLO|nr:hypothetical protein CYMTET_52369 [Cymbomonas tetramitiformis]
MGDDVLNAAQRVASHYSTRGNQTLFERRTSPIARLRILNNWIKSVLIKTYVHEDNHVLDIACGKGGDFPKWSRAKIGCYVGVDIAEGSVKTDAPERYNNGRVQKEYTFHARLFHADAFQVDLLPHIGDLGPFDIVSCQFAFHYCFNTEERAKQCLQNIGDALRPKGMFIGTTADANVLVKNLRKAESLSFGNSVYSVEFPQEHASKAFPPGTPFGIRYKFTLADAVEEVDEYLVPWPKLVELAAEVGLKPVLNANFHDYAAYNLTIAENVELLAGMGFEREAMSEDEWEASRIYMVMAFEKEGDTKDICSTGEGGCRCKRDSQGLK